MDPDRKAAVIVGGNSAIGAEVARRYAAEDRYDVLALARSAPALAGVNGVAVDIGDDAAFGKLLKSWQFGAVERLVVCTGALRTSDDGPEKSLKALREDDFLALMRVNAWLPLRVLQGFAPLLDRGGQVRIGVLSAQVGSIGDNALGGWYSYRMSKAALNMGIRCAAIELGRFRRGTVVAAIHPGTTRTPLTEGFVANRSVRGPEASARRIVDLLERLAPEDNGEFFHADGARLPW